MQYVLNFSASRDSQCCIVFHTASRCCFPLHSAGHGCLVARVGHRVRTHRFCLWCRNRCAPQRPQLQRWHVHRILRAFRVFFSPCTVGSCLFTDPCFSPILGVSNHFQTVFPAKKQSQQGVSSALVVRRPCVSRSAFHVVSERFRVTVRPGILIFFRAR